MENRAAQGQSVSFLQSIENIGFVQIAFAICHEEYVNIDLEMYLTILKKSQIIKMWTIS